MYHARPDYNGRIVDLDRKIPESEPVFLLRAQDQTAAETVRFWAYLQGLNAPPPIAMMAMRHADRMERWRVDTGTAKRADLPGKDIAESPMMQGRRSPQGWQPSRRQARVIQDILHERQRQEELREVEKRFTHTAATPGISNADRLAIITEEVGEVARTVLGLRRIVTSPGPYSLREEVLHVASTAFAWLEMMETVGDNRDEITAFPAALAPHNGCPPPTYQAEFTRVPK